MGTAIPATDTRPARPRSLRTPRELLFGLPANSTTHALLKRPASGVQKNFGQRVKHLLLALVKSLPRAEQDQFHFNATIFYRRRWWASSCNKEWDLICRLVTIAQDRQQWRTLSTVYLEATYS